MWDHQRASSWLVVYSYSRAQRRFLGVARGARPPPLPPPFETGCKVAGLHNSCIHSVALHSWCKITPFTQSCIMSSEILAPPQMKMWPPHWPPQTAAARKPLAERCRTDDLLPDLPVPCLPPRRVDSKVLGLNVIVDCSQPGGSRTPHGSQTTTD